MSSAVAVLGPGAVGGALAVRLARARPCTSSRRLAGNRCGDRARRSHARHARRFAHGASRSRRAARAAGRAAARDRQGARLSPRRSTASIRPSPRARRAAAQRARAPRAAPRPLRRRGRGGQHLRASRPTGRVPSRSSRRRRARIVTTSVEPRRGSSAARHSAAASTSGWRRTRRRVLWDKAVRARPACGRHGADAPTARRASRRPGLARDARGGGRRGCAVAAADGAPTTPAEQWAIIDAMADVSTSPRRRATSLQDGRRSSTRSSAASSVRATGSACRRRSSRACSQRLEARA